MGARILVVCTGNVCRSPFVEEVLRARLDAEFAPGHGITVASRGTQARVGDPMDERIQPYLRGALARLPGWVVREPAAPPHEAARLTAADVEAADLIVTAEREHRQAVNRLSARGLAQTFTLRQLAVLLTGVDPAELPEAPADRVRALARAAAKTRGIVPVHDSDQDVLDPHGRPPEAYEQAVGQLLASLDALTDALARRRPPPAAPLAPPERPPAESADRIADHSRAAVRPRRRRSAGRVTVRVTARVTARVAAVLTVVLLASGCWIGVRGYLAYRHLQQVQVAARQLKAEVKAEATTGTTTGTAAEVAVIQTNARAAHGLTADPVWRLAERAPLVGADLSAAGLVARVSDDVSQHALPPLTALVSSLAPSSSRPAGSARFAAYVAILRRQQTPLADASLSLTTSSNQLAAVDTRPLLGREGAAIRTLAAQLGEASSAVGAAARAAAALPAMFDTAAPKAYLLLFQNPAEARSLGGIAGAYAVVEADHGHFRLLRTGAADAIPRFRAPVLKLEPAYTGLFADQPGTYFVDTTQTPYFPDAARLASRMWQLHSGRAVDGVISTDPVMLSYLLGVIGPVTIPAFAGIPARTLTATNAVPYLLNGVYRTVADPNTQNLIFARTTAAVFAALTNGRGDPVGLVKVLRRGADEGRLLVWSPSRTVTTALAGTSLSGVPPSGTADRPTVGLYVNDGTGSKMSWYLRRAASLSVGAPTGGFRTVSVSLTLSSVAPTHGLPAYVSGGEAYGVPVGTSRNVVYILAPVGGSIVSAQVDGIARPLGSGQLHHRSVGVLTVDVGPGARHTMLVSLLAPAGTEDPQLLLQAMANPGASPT